MSDLIARLRVIQRPGSESDLTVMCAEAADEIEQLRAALARANRGESICLKCGLRQDGYDAAAHAAAYPGF